MTRSLRIIHRYVAPDRFAALLGAMPELLSTGDEKRQELRFPEKSEGLVRRKSGGLFICRHAASAWSTEPKVVSWPDLMLWTV